jgi:hypothetical protein
MTQIEQFSCGDKTVRISYDEDPPNPRTEWDNLGVMAAFHNRYSLGDKNPGVRSEDFGGWGEMRAYIEKDLDAPLVIPLYLHDHGGITIATKPFGDPWDSGQVGFIYITRDRLQKEYGKKTITKKTLDQARKVLEGEVETYDDYLTGQVYSFVVEDEGRNEIDSLHGIYGFEHARQEARAAAGCKK